MSNIEIVDYNIPLGSNPGDNYTSIIYGIEVTYKQENCEYETAHLIVKSIPISGDQLELEKSGFIDKELNVYVKVDKFHAASMELLRKVIFHF